MGSQLLFPHECAMELRDARGEKWRALVERIASLPEDHEDSLAFALLMVQLCGCLECDLSSYKRSLGCPTCAQRTLHNNKSSENALLKRFERAKEEVQQFLAQREAEEMA